MYNGFACHLSVLSGFHLYAEVYDTYVGDGASQSLTVESNTNICAIVKNFSFYAKRTDGMQLLYHH